MSLSHGCRGCARFVCLKLDHAFRRLQGRNPQVGAVRFGPVDGGCGSTHRPPGQRGGSAGMQGLHCRLDNAAESGFDASWRTRMSALSIPRGASCGTLEAAGRLAASIGILGWECTGSPHAAPMLPSRCPHAACMLPSCCPHAALMLPPCCPHAAPMLPPCCPHAARMLPSCCPHAAW